MALNRKYGYSGFFIFDQIIIYVVYSFSMQTHIFVQMLSHYGLRRDSVCVELRFQSSISRLLLQDKNLGNLFSKNDDFW